MRGVSMKTKLLGTALALGLAAAPIAATAGGVSGGNANSNWTIYGWQNYSYEFVNNDSKSSDRINANAANIGFAASIDTGMSFGGQAVNVNLQCEQFTYHNFLTSSGFCNRNSKLGLSGAWGEIMFAQWLLPYNEMVAQWVDPFYDAGADSHTSIMGNIGYARGGGNFYNGGKFQTGGSGFDYAGVYSQAFNRRQEEIIQYWSPNLNGFNFRFAMTSGRNNDANIPGSDDNLDPRIWSTGLSYENTLSNGNNVWLAVTYEKHDEWGAFELNSDIDGLGGSITGTTSCDDSDDDAYRVAGRYIHQLGSGASVQVSAMWENLQYDTDCDAVNIYSDTERDSWMISGKINFVGPMDLRFSYMDADEWDCGNGGDCGGFSEDDTDATAFNVGAYYTMPAGTELRLTYSMVDNEDNANYDLGITGSGGGGAGAGDDTDMIAFGVVQWF